MREKGRKKKRKEGDPLLLLSPFTPAQENVTRQTSMCTMKATIPVLQRSQNPGKKDTRKTDTVQHCTTKKLYANEDSAISTWQLPFLGYGPHHLNNKNWKGEGSVKRGQTPREPLGFSWLIDSMNSIASPTPASPIPPPPAHLHPLQVWKEKYWKSSCLGSF